MNDLYQKWREHEAYEVPMTPEGVKASQERWDEFNKGYKQAINDVVTLFMLQHEAAKESHNYWKVASTLVQSELK